MNDNKIPAFDYLVKKLLDWHMEVCPDANSNDLSKLKITKLLFFTVAISSNSQSEGLLGTFDNFVALPYGHVESDIQNSMDSSDIFDISKTCVNFRDGLNDIEYRANENIQTQIDEAVKALKKVNINLIKYKAFDLVDLSHKWYSWKTVYSLARSQGKFSMKIPKEMIMSELKVFSIYN